MITEIRDHFSAQIKAIDSDLRFDGFAFDADRISANNIDNAFKLVIGETTTERLDVSIRATVQVQVVIFRQSGTERIEDFDQLYCKALAIHSKCSLQEDIDQEGYIKSIEPKNIVPSPFDTDENSVKITIAFDVIAYYSLEA